LKEALRLLHTVVDLKLASYLTVGSSETEWYMVTLEVTETKLAVAARRTLEQYSGVVAFPWVILVLMVPPRLGCLRPFLYTEREAKKSNAKGHQEDTTGRTQVNSLLYFISLLAA
jgi:hypothetical protein